VHPGEQLGLLSGSAGGLRLFLLFRDLGLQRGRDISAAIEAGVDETILYLQRGHSAARAYMQLSLQACFLEIFKAIGRWRLKRGAF
jgi:hypothetical protein